jgi:hypothetical protein
MFSCSLLPDIIWAEFIHKRNLMWQGGKLIKIPDGRGVKTYKKATGPNAYIIRITEERGIEILPGKE